MEEENYKRKAVVFLSSSLVNLAMRTAKEIPEFDVFLIHDRKVPFETYDLDNFYSFVFAKQKLFEKDREAYFDNLSVFIEDFNPSFIICNNFTKLLSKGFIEFQKFRNPQIKILNIHHADLRVMDSNEMRYSGMHGDIRQFLETGEIVSTIHYIEDERMDEGKQIAHSKPTKLSELKQKGFIKKKEEIINLRVRSVIISYHENVKVLGILRKILSE